MSDWDPWWSPDSYSDYVSEGEGLTDAKGRFSFVVQDTNKEVKGAQDYVVRASVRDATDQEVTKSFVIHADPSDFYLGLHTEQWVATVGKPLRLDMVAVCSRPEGHAGEHGSHADARARALGVQADRRTLLVVPVVQAQARQAVGEDRPAHAGSGSRGQVTIDKPGEYTLRPGRQGRPRQAGFERDLGG